jgi:DHA1 family inner membrane transport protein
MTVPVGHLAGAAQAPATGRLLLLFAAVNLLIGSAAFMNTGLLEPMAESLGTSVAAVGQTTTLYAVATAVLAPVVLTLTGRMSRRGALAAVFAVFTLAMRSRPWRPTCPRCLWRAC